MMVVMKMEMLVMLDKVMIMMYDFPLVIWVHVVSDSEGKESYDDDGIDSEGG